MQNISRDKRQIAIIGGGFSGLATAYFLSLKGYRIKLYDSAPIGENASGISAGLLHCYTGPKAKRPDLAEEKLRSTVQLLEAASAALNDSVYTKTGLFRPALSKEQQCYFQQSASQNSTVYWLSAEEAQERFAPLSPHPGIWIENGYQIATKRYLKGLWDACEKLGAEWKLQKVNSTDQLPEDLVVIATGAASFNELNALSLHPIKGQILEIEWNHSLPFPISGNIYLVPGSTGNRCFIGGTFEHQFTDTKPDEEAAKAHLLPKLNNLVSDIRSLKVISCQAALRASTPDRKPILKQLNPRTWCLVGMGSKGLLNHAHYAHELVRRMTLQAK